MYLDKIIYCKPIECTIVKLVADIYDFEPSVSLEQEEREKWGQSGDLVPGKNMKPHNTLERPNGGLISYNMKNKANFLVYIGNSWTKNNASFPADLKVVIGGL